MAIHLQRTPEQIQSEVNRLEANIKQVKNSSHFTTIEREKLLPIYERQLAKLEAELSGYDLAKNINVVNPIEIKCQNTDA